MKITQTVFSSHAYFLIESPSGLLITLSELGAGIHDLVYKGRHLIASPEDKGVYEHSTGYFGKSVGRVAGRLKNHVLPYRGKEFPLVPNEGSTTLHGGSTGFSFRPFKSDIELLEEGCRVDFYLFSPDGDDGFPGDLTLRIRYIVFANEPRFRIETKAVSEKGSLFGYTNHVYWNLNGKGDVLSHVLSIDADAVMEYSGHLIPERFVPLSPELDFRAGKKIGKDVFSKKLIASPFNGYDHAFRFAPGEGEKILLRGDDLSLHVSTSFSGVQFYSDGAFPQDKTILTNGEEHARFAGAALEPSFSTVELEKMLIAPGGIQRTYIDYLLKEESK